MKTIRMDGKREKRPLSTVATTFSRSPGPHGVSTALALILTAPSPVCPLQAVSEQTAITLPQSVKNIMDPWILQMGFPVITLNTKTGSISQKHFLLDPDSVVTRPSNFRWADRLPGPVGVLMRVPRGLACGGPTPSAVHRLSFLGQEEGVLGGRDGQRVGAGAGLLCAGGGQGRLSPPTSGLFCSYQWIVHISSLKNGAQQADTWLEGATKSNADLPL